MTSLLFLFFTNIILVLRLATISFGTLLVCINIGLFTYIHQKEQSIDIKKKKKENKYYITNIIILSRYATNDITFKSFFLSISFE